MIPLQAAGRLPLAARAAELAPGVFAAAAVAAVAALLQPRIAGLLPIPTMVVALILGIALNPFASRPALKPGMIFCYKVVLRWAVALLGLRIALADIAALGFGVAILVIVAMAATLLAGFGFARLTNRPPGFGALAGAATAVCGASATLATSTVVPAYPGKEADIAFTVVAVNALSTLAMVAYPPLCAALGFDQHVTGILLGASIHDVAQVVGAGYATSETAGNTAVIVKLFRVFLLLPVVVALGWYFARAAARLEDAPVARVPVPDFAIAFLGLCLVNSAALHLPALAPVYGPVKAALGDASNAGLLLAIGALGLGTSLRQIAGLGWRHVATVSATTLVILAVVTLGLLLLR